MTPTEQIRQLQELVSHLRNLLDQKELLLQAAYDDLRKAGILVKKP